MKQELETLRAELHSIVDAKIDKLIKPMGLDQIADEISYTTKDKVIDYLIQNKTQIIETLNYL